MRFLLLLALLCSVARGQDLLTRPEGPTPMPVEVRLHLLDINTIRASDQTFSVLAEVFITWQDPRLQPNRRYAPESVWTPPLQFANAQEVTVMLDGVRAVGGGKVERARKLRLTCNSPFDFRDFPFDQDRLLMVLAPGPTGRQSEVAIHPFPDGLDRQMFDGEWDFGDLQARMEGDRAKFSLLVVRRYWFYVWSFFLPPLLICMMAWGQDRVMPPNLQVTSNSVVALVAHKFAMASTMPRIAYLCYADGYFLICLGWVFTTHMTTAGIMHLDEKGRKDRRDLVRRIGKWSFPIGFGLANIAIALAFL